jgi:ATP-dependent DNA helicase RecG
MLTEEELHSLAAELESHRVERKASLSDKGKVEEAICAFSNDLPGTGLPGVLLVGVRDADGAPTGLAITDELLRTLSSIRSDGNILPFPLMTVYRAELSGTPIAVVEVEPSKSPPVRLRGRTVIRSGPRAGTATLDEERILIERRRSFELSFDQRVVHGASLAELDLALFERELLRLAIPADVLERNGRSAAEQLAALHMASPDAIPTVAGLLVLGHDPTGFVPGAYVQFVRFDGVDVTAPIVDRKELVGPLPEILRRADEIAKAHTRTSTRVDAQSTEILAPDYPLVAFQQVFRNAVMHRNYETSHAPVQWYWFNDRVEIHNPGGLFGRATPSTFDKPGGNDYRNPIIAAALHSMGFVQRFGMGVSLARRECELNGNPEPRFIIEAASFAVVIGARR